MFVRLLMLVLCVNTPAYASEFHIFDIDQDQDGLPDSEDHQPLRPWVITHERLSWIDDQYHAVKSPDYKDLTCQPGLVLTSSKFPPGDWYLVHDWAESRPIPATKISVDATGRATIPCPDLYVDLPQTHVFNPVDIENHRYIPNLNIQFIPVNDIEKEGQGVSRPWNAFVRGGGLPDFALPSGVRPACIPGELISLRDSFQASWRVVHINDSGDVAVQPLIETNADARGARGREGAWMCPELKGNKAESYQIHVAEL